MSEPRHPKLNIKFDTQKARRAGSLTRDAAQNPSSASARSPRPAQVEGCGCTSGPCCWKPDVIQVPGFAGMEIYYSHKGTRIRYLGENGLVDDYASGLTVSLVNGLIRQAKVADSTKAKVERLEAAARELADAVDTFMEAADKGKYIQAQAQFPIGDSLVWMLKDKVNAARAALIESPTEEG